MKKHNLFYRILAYTLILSLVLSMVVFSPVTMAVAESDIVSWSTDAAESFAGGNGTEVDPYLIENADQLYKMVSEYNTYETSFGKYFKITKDIYINDVSDGTAIAELSGKKNWLAAYGESITTASAANSFNGTLDGNGKTIYGLYIKDVKSAGLFPAIASYAVIKNLNFDNLLITGDGGYGAAIAGQGYYYYNKSSYGTAKITNCAVTNATIGVDENLESAAAFLGSINDLSVTFDKCFSNNTSISCWNGLPGGIVGYAWSSGTLTINNCYSAGYFPTNSNVSKAKCTNVYTNVAIPEGNTTVGVTVLSDEQMKGENAKDYMTGFSFRFVWETVENGYPILNPRGEIWDGKWVTDFSSFEGNGTEESPYLIENGAQLAFALVKNPTLNGNHHYKLVEDIILNDTRVDNWKNNPTKWLHQTANRFIGVLDGDGHTIEGLYMNTSTKRPGLVSYSQGTFKNINFVGASINYTGTSEPGVAIVAAQTSGPTNFEKIYIDETSEINSTAVKGVAALAGRGYDKTGIVNITNCAVLATINAEGAECGALAGSHWLSAATVTIKNSFSTSSLPLLGGTVAITNPKNNYSVVEDSNGTTVLTADQMKGENAKKYMAGLSFRFIWETVENGYPIINPRGEIWDGTWVSSHDDFEGSGTKDDPYLIKNGAQLFFAAIKNSNLTDGSYYKLVEDIILNDTSVEGWEASAQPWGMNSSKRFNGTLDGDGHTIEGLYINVNSTDGRYGLFSYVGQDTTVSDKVCEIKNITFKGASVTNTTTSTFEGVGIVAGQASGETIFENIYIDETSKVNAPKVKGVAGIVARSNQKVTINNCAVHGTYTGGSHVSSFLGTFWGGNQYINNSYSAANVPVTTSRTPTIVNVYATVKTEDNYYDKAVVLLTEEQMKGEAAKENMPGLDFNITWKTVENGYPILRKDSLKAWDGSIAETLQGEGTKANPYKISNGAELYYAISTYSNQDYNTLIENKPYFELTSDINLGNLQWYNVGVTSYPQSSNYKTGFAGVIYGNGHTIYNLYNNVAAGVAGLIPVATQGTEIYDLHLVGGYLPKVVWNNYAAGGLIGLAVGKEGSTPITISGCSVEGYTVKSRDASGAFVGSIYSQSLIIKDCYAIKNDITHDSTVEAMNSSAFAAVHGKGNGIGNSISIENCYTDMNAKVNYEYEITITYENVYTTLEGYDNSVEGLTKVNSDSINGVAAKSALEGFNFNQVWKTVEGGYPVHQSIEERAIAWDGTIADDFAGGKGTAEEPFLISNARELYLLANSDRETTLGKYYKLTNDITISNVYDNWANENPYSWTKQKAFLDGFAYTSSFAGVLDGAGYTVSGLYCEDAITDNGTYAYGLIPYATASAVIRNLNVENVNINVTGNAYAGAVVGAAHVSIDDANNSLKYVNFVDVNVTDCDITATNSNDILGGATRGVKFNRCDGKTLDSNKENKIFNLECNEGLAVDSGLVVYNDLNANEELFIAVKQALLNNQELDIVDINCVEGFDIADLVAVDECINAQLPEESLVWSQEFNGDALDYSVWRKNTVMSEGSTLEYADNNTFSGESMTLYCEDTNKTDANGDKIYSVNYGLDTLNKMSFKYGRLEMRAKIPFGAGAFPSLWLVSRNALGNAPINEFDTEIDIFEVFGKQATNTKMVSCIHKWYNDENGDRLYREGEDGKKIYDIECSCGTGLLAGNLYEIEEEDRDFIITGIAQEEWHTVTFEWTEDTMTFAVDGNIFYTAKRSEMDYFDISGYKTNSDAIFNQFLTLRVNNHMYTTGDGSAYKYQGDVSEIDASKLNYEIDYIRLYQKNDGISKINIK